MKKYILIISFLIVLGLMFNFNTSTIQATTVVEIQKSIQIIKQQLAQLQQQLRELAETSQPFLWGWSTCTPQNPCLAGQGDCDTDADCAVGLFCAQNVGAKYDQVGAMDGCERKESSVCAYLLSGVRDNYRAKCGDTDYNPVFDFNKDGVINISDLTLITTNQNNEAWCKKKKASTVNPCEKESITVLTPNGGERWVIGRTYEIRWKAEGVQGDFTILLRDDRAGSSYKTIAARIPSSSRKYSWKIPSDFWGPYSPGNTYKIQVRKLIERTGTKGVFDESDNYFSIVKPVAETSQPFLWGWSTCTPQNPCLAGQGDCDTDADCAVGLFCAQNVGAKYDQVGAMDGCERKESSVCAYLLSGVRDNYRAKCGDTDYNPVFDFNKDGVINISDLTLITTNQNNEAWCKKKKASTVVVGPVLWDWDFCAPGRPCSVSQGDCDRDSDCATGLFCAQNVGRKYGQVSSMDVCEKEKKVPSITRVSPISGTSNDMITIYGKNLVDTIPSGVIIEFLKNGIQTATIGTQHIFTKRDGLSLRFQLIGLLVANQEPRTYQIRVVNDNGKSNAVNFTIVEPAVTPSITVLSPNGGEKLEEGKIHEIRWDAVGMDAGQKVHIHLRSQTIRGEKGGKTITKHVLANTERFSWKVSSFIPGVGEKIREDRFKIFVATHVAHPHFVPGASPVSPNLSDDSDNYFSIIGF